MKILYITTIGGTMSFFKSLISELIKEGNIVDIATNEETSRVPDCYREWGCKVYSISTSRSPFSFGNIKAVKQIRSIAKNYDIVHCHTPLAGMATRFACRKLRKKRGLKVIYTAHGFHFYKGAPKKNWIIYYPIEKICSRWTDVLITINKEDYEFANKKMKAKKVEYIPGVGIDIKRFSEATVDRKEKRKNLGIPNDAFLILSVGELNDNKNHRIVIKAIAELNDPYIHYVIAGNGTKEEELRKLAKELNVNLHLLGFRKDVADLYKAADLFVHPSFREGLPVAVMEAIASGCKCLCSNIRGCKDLVSEDFLFSPYDSDELRKLINSCINGETPFFNNGVKELDYRKINEKMFKIYYRAQNGSEL